MGLRNAFVRSGKYGKSQASSSTGFSASRYYSRNAASAGSFMAPAAPASAASQQLDTRRPYSGVGKTSINLFGRPVSPPSQELKEMPGAFEGVPVLGTIADGLAGLGSLPIPLEYVPGFGSLGTTRTAAKQEAALHPTEFAEFARKQATEKGVPLEENWATDMRLMTDFARQQFIAKGNSELAAAAMFTPTDDTVGGAFEALLRGITMPQQAVQRSLIGAGLKVGPIDIGNTRVEDLLTRSDADLEGNPQLIAIRDDYKNGRITRDVAMDRLVLAGHAITDPLGQSGPIKAIRSIGDNTPLDLPFDVVANALAAAGSLGLEVVTDPASLLSIGTGTAARLTVKGTAKGIAALTRNAGERGVREALESGALQTAKTADGLETAAASEIRNAAARAEFDRIRRLLPEGVAATDDNILRAGIRAKDPAVLEALRSTSIIERPFVSNEHVLKWMKNVENVMDPLTLFGRDKAGRMANKAVALHIIDGGTNQLGKHNIGPVMEALEKIGVTQERSGGDLGTAFANVGEQIGGEHLTRMHVKLGIGVDDAMDPVALSDLGSDMLSRHGRDVASMVKHKIAKVALLVVPREGETMASALAREQEMVADLLVKMYDGVDIEAARVATRGMNAEQLAVVRFMQYGNMADNLLNARALSASEAAAMGLSPDFVGRVIFLGPTQLTRGKAGELYKLIKKKDYAAIRQMVEKYDLLEWNISLGQDDAGLIKDLRRFLDNHVDNLPAAIDPKSMTPAMQAFKDKFGDSMELGLRGENVFQTGRNADGRIVSIDPFMDYVRGAAIGPGDVAPGNVVQRNVRRMLRGISGQHIIIEQNRRFAQRMSQEFGVNREQTDAMLSLARTMANQHKAASPRGLSQDLLYESAMAALPKRWKTKIGSRELQRAIFFAMEGSTSTVGLTQKFTGRIKSAEVNRFGTNYTGTLSEWLYPNAKFRWSLFFQLQEGVETPVLLIARGMASPQQFTGALTGTRAGAGAALRAGRGGRRAAFRKARTRSVEEARDLEYQTAVMMDAFVGGVRYEGDMIEMTNIMRRGSAAAAAAASTREGRALASLVNDSKIARLKTRGQLISFRHQVGNDMARMLQRESPASWATARGFYNTSGNVSDAEVAIRWFNDLLMRNNPDSAFSAVKAHRNPAEFFRPGFLGRRTRWSEDIVLEGLSGELDNPNISFKQLRKRYLDPEDDVVTEQWLDERLRALGADENYIQRTKWRMDYPTEKEWEAKILELTGDPEATAKHMEAHRLEAAQEGLPLIESLADKYHGPPQVLDENGEWKDTTLFQLTADLLDSRGLPTVSMTHPDVVVGGTMAQIGQRVQTDISLPPAVGALEWESHALAQHTEMVPMSLVAKMEPGNALRVDEKELAALAADIKSNGMREPIQLTYYAGSRTVVIGEGNHRTAALLQLYQSNPAALRGEHIPVTVFRYEGSGPGTKVPGKDPDEFGYTPGNMRPSDIGVGNAESAAVIRHDAALLRETKVKNLTPAEAKGREYQQVRVTRTADPDLGRPKTILEMGGDGRLVARNADGKVTHRIGGHKTPTEWVEELEATMTNDAMREHSRWYIDMRRAFLALSDNQQEEATHLLMAFGITQLNTSPVAGMKYMLHIVESVRRGGEMPADIKQLQKVAGLNGSALKHFMEQGYVSEKGMGQKLIDFVDSLIGVNGRTVPVRGPNGTWTAVAGDIWAKRDVGYVDGKMLKHLQHAYGRQYEVKAVGNRLRKNKDTGEMEEVADTFQFTDRETGQSFRLDPAEVKGNPTSLEYDAIVEFYNDAADHLNEIGFLDRKDWVAAEAQALGWFKAKKVYNDPTGDPRTALTESMWNTRVDVMPSSTAVMSEMYPEVAEHTGRAIAGETGHQFSDEAERISGVQVMSSYGSVRRTSDGRLGAATNFEVLASPDGVRLYMATLGTVSHNARVRATRATLTKPTKANGVRPMVELTFPPSMSPQDMDGAFKALAEDSEFFGDADLVQRADGTWAIRVVAEPGESEAKFAARMDDNTLRDFHASVSSPEGYGRGRYINPDKPMAPGAREQGIRDRGDAVLARSMEDPKPITWTDENIDDLADDLWQAAKRPDGEDDWNGLTILSHSGERPKPHGTFEGDGPFSTGVGTTVSLPLDVSEAEFKQAVRDFVEANRVYLERQKGAIGVFRDLDPDHMRIDLDANLIVDDIDDVEAVQLVLGREGGAYDFSAGPEGNGVYLPQFDPRRANSIERGYADVIEMDNDWAANPNGEGYTAHIKKPRRFEEDTEVVAEAKARVKGAKGLAQTKVGWNDGIEESFRRTGDLKVPERANTVYRKQKGVLLAYDGEGNLVGSLMYAAEPGSYGVLNIMSRYPRQGTATRLYDEALALDGDEFIKAIGQTSMTPEGKKFASAWLKKQKKQTTEVRRGELEQAAGELEREGVQWGRMVWEKAYQRVAGREVAAHRVRRNASGDTRFDVSNPAGYLQSSPRGTRAARFAIADDTRGRRLFQRTPGGRPAGAITDAGTALSTTPVGRRPRRAQLYVHPKRKQGDTLLHEYAHDFINRLLHESGRRRAKAVYAGREGTLPTPGSRTRSHVLTVDEQEWLADQLIEYLRQGPKAVAHPSLVPLAEYYSKTLKAKRRRVEPDLTEYTAREAAHAEAMTSYEARRAAHEAERARQLNPEPEDIPAAPVAAAPDEDAVAAMGQRDAVRAMHKKWDQSGTKNGARMEKDLIALEQQDIDVAEEMNLLDEYTNMERSDFDDAEEFREARAEVWDQLLETLDNKATHYLEDLGLEEVAEAVPVAAAAPPPPRVPVDIGEFGEVAPTPPVRPRAKSEVVTLHPDAKALFDTIDKSPKPKNAYAYDVEEENVLKWMYASHRRADRSAKDLIHFKGERSWLERSLNHPYFGMYPLSYMWGKILPEMVEFMLFRPFGVKAPGVALNYTNKMYQHTMNAMENDPELRAWMAENEEALRAISMLVPGVPWDLPVNTPLPLRRYVEAVATNLRKDMDGEQPEEYGAWEAFVSDIDYRRIAGDVIGYTFGPKTGTETLLSYPGLIGKAASGMQPATEEELATNPQFIPPTQSQPQSVAPVRPPVGQPSSRVAPTDQTPDDVAELTDLLGEEYAEVANRIAGGG